MTDGLVIIRGKKPLHSGSMYRAIVKVKGILKINWLIGRVKLNEECLFIFKFPNNEEIARCKCPFKKE